MRNILLVFGVLTASTMAFATVAIQVLPNRGAHITMSTIAGQKIGNIVAQRVDLSQYRGVKAQLIVDRFGRPDHILVYLQEKGIHRVDFAAIRLNGQFRAISNALPYQLQAVDIAQQSTPGFVPKCPDPSVQFISFAPNDNDFEVGVATDVATAAKAAHLKTVELYRTAATHDAYLNYMTCPNLIGNFYDGDSDPSEFVTNDGVISAAEMAALNGAFRFKVTNIWLACEAYNDPMLSAVEKGAAAQKYAAGISDLQIGPSDQAGKCTMIAAIQGQPMKEAFTACYQQFDNSADVWGFGGNGSDLFGR